MPREQYNPVPTVKPEQVRGEIATSPIRIDFPSVHISGAVGQALEKVGELGYGTLSRATAHVGAAFDNLGKSIEGAGDTIWKRAVALQQLENETKENKAMTEFQRYSDEKRLEYEQKVGEAAGPGVMRAHIDDLEQKRQQLRDMLPATSQRAFDRATVGMMGREGIHAANHAATQMKVAASGAAEANIDMAVKELSQANNNEDAQAAFKKIQDLVHGTYGPVHGWNSNQSTVYADKKAEQGVAAMIERISNTEPRKAQTMLDNNPDMFITPGLEQRVRNSIRTDKLRIEGRNIADEIENKDRDVPLEDKIEAVKKRAKEIDPDDPDLPAAAESRLITMHNIHRKEENEELQKHLDNTKNAAYGYGVPGGKKPRTQEELEVDPKAKIGYAALNSSQRHQVDTILENNAKEDYKPTPATRARFNQLWGAAHSNDPREMAEFMQTDLENEKIPANKRDQLYHRQVELRGKPLVENPVVSHAMKVIQLPEPIRTGRSPELRKEFMGALYIALQDAQERKGKVPLNDDEIKDIGAMVLRTEAETEGVRGLGWVPSMFDRPLFEQMRDVPTPFSEALRKLQPNITDQKILDAWSYHRLRSKFEELQNTVKPAAKPPSP